MHLARSSDPTLAFWGRVARFIIPLGFVGLIVNFAGGIAIDSVFRHDFLVRESMHSLQMLATFSLTALMGMVVFAAGRAAARMSDGERGGAMPQLLLTTGRTSRRYWEYQAVFGGLFAAVSIFAIALVVAGEL